MSNKFYITTTLPYINANPHIGFAREIIEADVLARFYRAQGKEVFFNTGTDEHGLKIFRKAQDLGIDTQKYCDEKAPEFDKLKKSLNLSYDNFIRTTDKKHIKAAQEFWKLCDQNGYIYKKNYKIKYCVGCELEKTDSELEDGKCLDHPNMDLEIIEEENYFFRYSAFQDKLKKLYESNPGLVIPAKRFNEVKSFVERGLQDFSISRLKEKMPWGIPVPDDEDQVMYVWFDALVNYISAIGWPKNQEKFREWWPAIQLCGKDNLRPQSAMWQAMLMSINLSPSKQIFVNGFINVDGQKMSKSLGNVISPYEMVDKFGVDGTRYLLLNAGAFGEDVNITWKNLVEKYNADLANGLGNLVSRVIKLSENLKGECKKFNSLEEILKDKYYHWIEKEWLGKINALDLVLDFCISETRILDKEIGDSKPWELIKKDDEKFENIMDKVTQSISAIAIILDPFLPETAEKIKKALETKKIDEVLFQRIK